MNQRSSRKLLVTGGILFAAIWLLFVLWVFGSASVSQEKRDPGQHKPDNISMEQIYNFDVRNKRLLVGFSTDVFVGRVQKQTSSKPAASTIPHDDGHPQTQYAVEVLSTLKGSTTPGRTVVVNQVGGVGESSGKTYVVEGVAAHGVSALDEPLKPGTRYVFSTTTDTKTSWLTLSAQPWGKERLSKGTGSQTIKIYERAVKTQADPYAEDSLDTENQ